MTSERGSAHAAPSPVRSHETDSTDPYQRGHELGAACADGVRTAYAAYCGLWAAFGVTPDEVGEVGTAVLGPIEAYAPAQRAEIAGVAAGSGLEDWQVGALNARSELLSLGDQRSLARGRPAAPEPGECSTLVRLPSAGGPVTAQTWDWHTPLAGSWFVWTLVLPGGRRVRTLTEYGITGKIGVATDPDAAAVGVDAARSGTLGLHFNALRHRDDTGRSGVPVHTVARRVLDEARTVDDAVRLAAAAEVSASAAVTVTARDPAGEGWSACTIELRPGATSVLPAHDGERGRWLAHTNHFDADEVPADEQVLPEVSTSRQRLDRVASLARSPQDGDAPVESRLLAQRLADQLATHDLGPRSVCVHGFPDAPVGERTATLAVAVAEPASGRLHVHAGRPCDARPQSWWSG